MKYIDLHTHSTASDGSFSPSKVAMLAESADMKSIALTDHDTMAGVEECFKMGLQLDLPVIAGVEMSCVYNSKEIHILGYLLPDNFPAKNLHIKDEVLADLEFFARERADRNAEIIDRFKKDGIIISTDDLIGSNPHTQITRAHFANALIKMGIVADTSEAFLKYLEYGGKYIPVKKITTKRCIEFLNTHHFFISLAHPFQYKFSDTQLESLLSHLINSGLNGIEVYHSTHSDEDKKKLNFLAKKYNLFPTGGSDFHGAHKPGLNIGTGYGDLKVPYTILEDILAQNKY